MSFFPKKKKEKRAVVLGLDGVPYSLLADYIEQDFMPNLRVITEAGSFKSIEASIPEVSSVSWTTFMTGVNPGEHGVYGFMEFAPGTYRFTFTNSNDIKSPPVWDELGKIEKRSVVINLPSTYPAKPMEGVLVSGFVAVDLAKAVHPPELFNELMSMGYAVDMDLLKARQDADYLFEALEDELRMRKELASRLWQREDWSLFILVITGTDRLHHFQMKAALDDGHPEHNRFLDYYRKLDEFIGWFHKMFSSDCAKDDLFVMLSDHGFMPLSKEVYLNTLLKEHGYLNYSTENPKTIQEIGAGTKAFCLDPSRIYLNRTGKYPAGCVADHEIPGLIEELKKLFLTLDMEGRPVIREVYEGAKLYSGPNSHLAPDLVLLSNPGFDLKAAVAGGTVFGNSGLSGMHTQRDAHLFINREEGHFKTIQDIKKALVGHIC